MILSRAVLFVAFRYSTSSLLYAFYVLVMALIISTKGFGSYINCPQCFKLDSSSLKLEQSTWNKSEMISTWTFFKEFGYAQEDRNNCSICFTSAYLILCQGSHVDFFLQIGIRIWHKVQGSLYVPCCLDSLLDLARVDSWQEVFSRNDYEIQAQHFHQ